MVTQGGAVVPRKANSPPIPFSKHRAEKWVAADFISIFYCTESLTVCFCRLGAGLISTSA